MVFQLRRSAAFALVLVWALTGMALAQASYNIGPGDVIRVSILSKPDLDRDLTVDVNGTIHVPLIGNVTVIGQTIHDLRKDIPNLMTGAIYRERVGSESVLVTITSDEVLVDIAQYRPIYVDGAVNLPGEVPFVVGMTVRQAIAAANGVLGQELLTEEATPNEHPLVLSSELASVEAEIEYHRAILTGAQDIDIEAINNLAAPGAFREQMAGLLRLRLRSANGQLEAQRSHFAEGAARAKAQAASASERVALVVELTGLARAEVERQKDLAERGFTTFDTVAAAWLSYLELARHLRGLEQDLAALEARAGELALQEKTVVAERLERSNAEMIKLMGRAIALTSRLNAMTGFAALESQPAATVFEPSFRVFRKVGDQARNILVDPGTQLLPGDVLNVSFGDSSDTVLRNDTALVAE